MGFDEEQALYALNLNNNNVQQAIEYLITNLKSDENNGLDGFVLVNDEEEKKKMQNGEITMNDVKNHSISPWDIELYNEYQCELLSSFKLKQIITKCPTRTHLYKWKLIYSTEKHGISINTLYSKMEHFEEFILIINDTTYNDIFGAFIDCKWIKPKNKKQEQYKGTIDCFVFNYIDNDEIKDRDKKELQIYRGSGCKDSFLEMIPIH